MDGEVYFTQGAHSSDGSSTGIKSGIDLAPKRVTNCASGTKALAEEQTALATASGMLTIVGNERDANDPNHSIVEIQEDGSGLRFGVMHVSKLPDHVQVGNGIRIGTPIGKASCEVPKGGKTTGVHVHLHVKDKNGNYLPIDGFTFSGWTVQGDIMTKGSEKRVADQRRCNTDQACGGIRNDLVTGATLPTVPAAKPAPKEVNPPPGFSTHRSIIAPYQIDYPNNWRVSAFSNLKDTLTNNNYTLELFVDDNSGNQTAVLSEKINPWVKSSEDYRDHQINQLKTFTRATVSNITPRKVAGRDGWMLVYHSMYGNDNNIITIVFTDKGLGWQIRLSGKSNFTDQAISTFNQMVDTIKLR